MSSNSTLPAYPVAGTDVRGTQPVRSPVSLADLNMHQWLGKFLSAMLDAVGYKLDGFDDTQAFVRQPRGTIEWRWAQGRPLQLLER